MKIEKKIINESLGLKSRPYESFSTKKQNIVITEKQLEKLLEKLQKKWILENKFMNNLLKRK